MATQTRRPTVGDALAPRGDFPVLGRIVNGHRVVYLDSAASAQKPRPVLDRLSHFYAREYAKVNESHLLSRRATEEFESVRAKVAVFINAPDPEDVVFLRGASEALSLLGNAFADGVLRPGDEVLITEAEHHSNILPWQTACRKARAVLRAAPVAPDGAVDLDALEGMLSRRTKVVAVTHLSNVTGLVTPVERVVEVAHARGVPVVVDAAQSAPHLPVDVRAIGCDFLAASGHKMGGPTGAGFLYGRPDWLERIRPQEGGSEAAKVVRLDTEVEYKPLPYRHEDGTPAVAEVAAFGAALDYLGGVGMARVAAHVADLAAYAAAGLAEVPGVRLIGSATDRVGIVSFNVGKRKPRDVIAALDARGIAVGGPELAAQPLLRALGEREATAVRASFSLYSARRDIDTLVRAVTEIAAGPR
ncbi:aminotransferase class V-fold PLP-dependent enzyme [Gemmata sp.]|uniref:aminotransferase class V-fold PLP-dependent enzyme n=1 Tax=Gemmata sp. TaxID=1914242 RepID=UPI003F72C5A7